MHSLCGAGSDEGDGRTRGGHEHQSQGIDLLQAQLGEVGDINDLDFVKMIIAEHPILEGLSKEWRRRKEELFCGRFSPLATPLAEAMCREPKTSQTVV